MMTRKLPIIAVATAPGKAGVGVVRISGHNLGAITKALFQKVLSPRQANLLTLRDAGGQTLDQLSAIYFVAPASFTGEDVLELQCHGGPQLLELVMKRCLELGKDEGLVIAEPGEFTLRAYLNNKIDLAQAEAIADLIDAQSEAAVRGAARSLQGIFSESINDLIEEITQLRILVESTLDFPEEEIEFLENAQARERLAAVKEKLPMHIIDTAGLRETNDLVEAKGIERSWDAIRLADLVIFLTDPNSGEDGLKEQILLEIPPKCPVLEVLNKSDLMASDSVSGSKDAIRISAKTGDGIEPLKQHILEMVGWNSSQEGAIVARRRHLDCLERASEHIARSEQFAANGNNSLELFAEELFLVQNHLGQITGKLLPDELLGKIFSQFCIGK